MVKDGGNWHFYLKRTRGYSERRLVRLTTVADLQRIDMGIAMCHFELTARETGPKGNWLVDEPAHIRSEELCEYTASWVG